MIFKRISDEEIAETNRYLLNFMSESVLIQLINELGLTDIENKITLLRYGSRRLPIEELCSELNLSLSTYKRHRRNILYKVSLFIALNSENINETKQQ